MLIRLLRPLRVPSPSRRSRLRPSTVACALGVLCAVAGCGKSLPREAGGAGVLAPVNPQGAGGLATKNTTRLGGADAATDAAAVARAVYPGLTAAGRPTAVVLVNERDWPAALAASALAAAPLRAPLLYSAGEALPQVSARALSAMGPTGAPALAGAQVIAIGGAASPSGYRTRVVGAGDDDPFQQAAAIARLLAATRHGAVRDVIVASADGPPALAMPAAGLAAQTGAPILLVTRDGVPPATAAALARLHKPAIYAVGPPSALSSATLRQLMRFGTAKRIVIPATSIDGKALALAGEDPVDNAITVSLYRDGAFGWGVEEAGHGLVFANASRPLDAPAAAPLSASGDYAPLLLLSAPAPVPAKLATYLGDIEPGYSEAFRPVRGVYNHGWLIGGEEAISATTQAELDAMLEISPSRTPSGAAPAGAAPPAAEEPPAETTAEAPVTPTSSTQTNPTPKP